MTNTRELLESALVAEPDNLALHSAYADLLIEEGDPRGDYIRLQLELEDASLDLDQRRESWRQAKILNGHHNRAWLGALHPYTIVWPQTSDYDENARAGADVTWKRGWLESITIRNLHWSILQSLNDCPTSKLLRAVWFDYDPDSPTFQQVVSGPWLIGDLLRFPLHTLLLHNRPEFGDELVERLVNTGLFTRLQHLSLVNCGLTDDGARLLANHPYSPRLKSLNLENNFLSEVGVAALAEAGIRDVGGQRDHPSWETSDDGT